LRTSRQCRAPAAADRGEWLTITVSFERLEHAHRELVGLDERFEVLGPPALRERVAASAPHYRRALRVWGAQTRRTRIRGCF
jgi:predicted DNA-binding transcriptional regulator YafY